MPDAAASFRERPRDAKPKLPLPDDLDSTSAPAARPGRAAAGRRRPGRRGLDDAGMPPLPRSELGPLNRHPAADGRRQSSGRDRGRAGRPCRASRARTRARDPFDPLAPTLPRSNAGSSPRGPATTPDGPSLEPPQGVTSDDRGRPGESTRSPIRATRSWPSPRCRDRRPTQPADPALATTTMPSSLPPDGSTVELPAHEPTPAPAQAPRRTGLIGGLFNNMSNWRRR